MEVNKKMQNSRKTVIFVAMGLMLSGWLMVLPIAKGAIGGADIGSAPTLEPGIYANEMRLDVSTLYYNVSGTVGANLTAIITWVDTNCSRVAILAPNGSELDADQGSSCSDGIAIASVICDSNQLYTIRVGAPFAVRGVSEIIFTLTICLDGDCGQGGGIPGFDLIIIGFGLVALMGIMRFWNRQKGQLL
jgi:hypothetical protein